MHLPSEAMERFFRTFESNTVDDSVDSAVSQFAEVFMAASPQGAKAVRASDFALALPKRKQLFHKLGCRCTELVWLREQRLDARYSLASTHWKMTFERADIQTQHVVVESAYIVDTGGDEPKIVFYLASQDLMQILKERGVIVA